VLQPVGYSPGGMLNGQTLPKTGSVPNMVHSLAEFLAAYPLAFLPPRDTHSIFANVEFAY
jgi:hypothetical protein